MLSINLAGLRKNRAISFSAEDLQEILASPIFALTKVPSLCNNLNNCITLLRNVLQQLDPRFHC
jgi:hypothetical protein